MFHHCNHPILFGHFEHLELPRRCIVTWHLLAANSKLVENFEPSSEYSLWCWQQRKIVSEYSQLACEWFLPWQEIRLYDCNRHKGTRFIAIWSHSDEILIVLMAKGTHWLCDFKTTSKVSTMSIVGSVVLSLPANRQIGVRIPTREVSLISSNFLNTGCGMSLVWKM